MLIPSYYDAPDRLEGSMPMRGDDPRHDVDVQLHHAGSARATRIIRCGRFAG